ncbi:MAG: DUF1579 domain-containing protein [Isosphaeraceae bacterium]|nr:DUF1579 domain-containing protein [Isosphaeraceae bacterium]
MKSAQAAVMLLVISLSFAVDSARAQDAPPIPQPTAEHKILAADAGKWDAEIKSYSSGPDAEPKISKGTEVNTVVAGGLWTISEFHGTVEGLDFEGRGQYGFDPIKKKYVGTWIDSWNPTLSVIEGTYDAASKTLTMTGEGMEVNSKTKYQQKMVTKTNADGSRTFTFFMKGEFTGGNEVKMMEITYRKAK